MSKEILEQLFDSPAKVRLLKFFLRNSGVYSLKEILRRTKCEMGACRTQLNKLESIDLIKIKIKKGRKYYQVNPEFDFFNELRILVLKSSPTSKQKILNRLKALGRIKLAILSGVFINLENARMDLLVVGEGIKQIKLGKFLKELEAEVGKEINYVVLTTEEFHYRHSMFDRFIRDVLEKPHEKLINKIKI